LVKSEPPLDPSTLFFLTFGWDGRPGGRCG
jgi:hypothetical protein